MSSLPALLPRLTSLGHELDTSPEAFGELESSIDYIHDAEALRERMRVDGYLYLPGYLHRDEVLTARDEIAERLAAENCLDDSYPPHELVPRSGVNLRFLEESATQSPALMRLLYSDVMMEFYDSFFGKKALHFDYTWFRAVSPGNGTAAHMDIVYMGRGTPNVLTAWTPIVDVSIELGGLMILEKSHLHEKLNNNYAKKDVDKFCINRRGENYVEMGGGGNINRSGSLSFNPPLLRERLGGRWLTAHYQAGDLLTFSMNVVHAAIDNATDRIRLSSDSRYQPADEPIDERWFGENPIGHGPLAKRGMIC